MPIEFNAAKREATLEARGLDMARAGEVFAGATLTVEDNRRAYGRGPFHHNRGSPRHDGDRRLDAARWHASDHQYEESK